MSLSERLKVAEQARRASAGLGPDGPARATPAPQAWVDLSGPGAAVVDITDRAQAVHARPMPAATDSTSFGRVLPLTDDRTAGRTAGVPCPRCGGHTELDLFDQVNQTASLSCSSCFHMFRIELDD